MSKIDLTQKPGSLQAWLDYLDSIDPNKMKLGLERIKVVLERLNLSLFNEIPVITVAGTNGKGSTAALIANALNFSKIKTGLYTSPHLHKFNERVNIGGLDVTDEALVKAFSTVFDNAQDVPLSYFEYTTLAALICFANAHCGAVVLEVGLGGRLDATNAIDADIAVITSIGLDHCAILGDTIDKIAYEKAGIVKENCQVVTGPMENKALQAIKEQCDLKQAHLYAANDNYTASFKDGFSYIQKTSCNISTYKYPYPKVPYICAPVAIRALLLLKDQGVKVTHDGVVKAIKNTSLPGRMQLVNFAPMVYLDVAHNPPAATHLVNTLKNRALISKRVAVMGMLKDKDIESVLSIVKDSFDKFYVATLHTVRGESKERLVSALIKAGVNKDKIVAFDYVKDALDKALKDAQKTDEIIVCGSFVTVSEAQDELKALKDKAVK